VLKFLHVNALRREAKVAGLNECECRETVLSIDEDVIQCVACDGWYHKACVNEGSGSFICDLCLEDIELSNHDDCCKTCDRSLSWVIRLPQLL